MRMIRAVLSVAFRQNMMAMKPAGRGAPLMLFHIETGGCGGCGMELRALTSAPYDLGGAGFGLSSTPAGADMLLVSGPLTRMMAPVLQAAWEAMPDPKGIICMGDCALDGGVFGENYATLGGLERRVTIDLRLPGCPPTPADVLAGLVFLLGGGVQAETPPA